MEPTEAVYLILMPAKKLRKTGQGEKLRSVTL